MKWVELTELFSRSSTKDKLDNLGHYLSALPPGTKRQPIADRPRWRATERLSAGMAEEIVAAYLAGSPTPRLAEQYGLCRSSISKLLADRGVELRRRSLTKSEIDQAAELYSQGWSLAMVGQSFGRHPSVILRAFQNCAIPRRDCHGQERSSAP